MTVADNIAEWLYEKGITTAFGIVGGGNTAIFEAIAKLGKTRIVCVHHEQAAVMAAGSYYRISGRLSVAIVTTGAGSTNTVTGLASAWMDRVPVLILSGNESSKYLDANTRVLGVQGYRSAEFARPFTKAAAQVDADNWRVILDGFVDEILDAPYGPAWCDVPKNVQNAVV